MCGAPGAVGSDPAGIAYARAVIARPPAGRVKDFDSPPAAGRSARRSRRSAGAPTAAGPGDCRQPLQCAEFTGTRGSSANVRSAVHRRWLRVSVSRCHGCVKRCGTHQSAASPPAESQTGNYNSCDNRVIGVLHVKFVDVFAVRASRPAVRAALACVVAAPHDHRGLRQVRGTCTRCDGTAAQRSLRQRHRREKPAGFALEDIEVGNARRAAGDRADVHAEPRRRADVRHAAAA